MAGVRSRWAALAILLALLAVAPVSASRKKSERDIRAQEITCRTECGIVNIQESTAEQLNCLKRCISEECYEEVYASDPLELGEIDDRHLRFKQCLTKQQRGAQRLSKSPATTDDDAGEEDEVV